MQAQADLAAIRAFISQDSPHYASVVVARLIAAADRLIPFPESERRGEPVSQWVNSSHGTELAAIAQDPYATECHEAVDQEPQVRQRDWLMGRRLSSR